MDQILAVTEMPEATGLESRLQRDSSRVHPDHERSSFRECAVLFAGAFAVIFFLSYRIVNLYDEGLFLTAVMRTMAGQVIHRDFYYNYGPAQLYAMAGLFRLFGTSVLVERLAAAFSASGLVVSTYVLAHKFCRRAVSLAAAVLCAMWLIGLILQQSFMNATIPLLLLWSCWLMVPKASAKHPRRRTAAAGLLCGTLFLFRYDMGIGLAAANLFAVAIILWLREARLGRALYAFTTRSLWPYLVGFSIPAVPAIALYLSVAPLHDLLYDIVLYSAKYYAVARRLPFPKLTFDSRFGDFVVYILPLLIALSLWTAVREVLAQKRSSDHSNQPIPEWASLLITMGVAATVMYMKGFIRLSAGQVAMSTFLCLVMAAILFQHRGKLGTWVRTGLVVSLILLFASAATALDFWVRDGRHLRPMVINWLVTPKRQPPEAALRGWCQFKTPITKGMCFLLDSDHIKAVEYLDTHTSPADTLYVGLPHHDRIFINDNITYFAAQRLPATKWSHFDPFLQNRADIQAEMIGELQRNRPPYVVLDSEFDNVREPNGSSVSTGVHLLDDYIAGHYKQVEQFGELTILKRDP